jgi:PAS domain S-box-containing protein
LTGTEPDELPHRAGKALAVFGWTNAVLKSVKYAATESALYSAGNATAQAKMPRLIAPMSVNAIHPGSLPLPIVRKKPVVRYSVAVMVIAATFVIRYALDPWLHGSLGLLFIPAIAVTTLIAGSAAGLFAACISAFVTWYFFLPPLYTFQLSPDAAVGLGAYLLISAIVIGLIHWLQVTIAQLHTAQASTQGLARQQVSLIEDLQTTMERLHIAMQASGAATWGWDVVTNTLDDWTPEYRHLYGFSPSDPANFEDWWGRIHFADRLHLKERMRQMLANPGDDLWNEEFRIIHPQKGQRWIARWGRAVRDADGSVTRMSGVAMDITDRKQAEERERLLTRELRHRTKNLFTVIGAIAKRSLSGQQTLDQAREAFLGRLIALASADDRLITAESAGARIREMLETELAPYPGRYVMEGPDVLLQSRLVRDFSLAVHELATNALKYGSLSNESGKVMISWTSLKDNAGDKVKFTWKEIGGPEVDLPTRRGFGTSLLNATLGQTHIEYAREGIVYTVDLLIAKPQKLIPNGIRPSYSSGSANGSANPVLHSPKAG